ncbi:MAG TPA: MFS transporter [Candidatus Baltobacteraceae bacterium]|jgi:EmrB/QacA subfamily drug resistance transporter|nr:MFS transporter [Candidatus Baltobacteraceae bacterium]
MPDPRRASQPWILAAAILGSSLVFIDSTVVSIALPVLQDTFHASASAAQWVVESYTLVLGALMLLSGALGDRYGRRLLFISGVVVFAIGSVLCGLSNSMAELIAARVLQGIGGTMLAPASLALIGACFEGADRGKAIGTWSGLTSVASAIGPVAGGAIIDHLGWRWAFFINIPIALAVVLIALRHVPESRDEGERGTPDIAGSLLITGGLAGIVYAFVASGQDGWNAATIAALCAGALALAAFVLFESKAADPILPLKLFARRDFTGINVMTLLIYGALSGLFYFLPFVMIQVDGYTATVTGAAMLPFIVLMVLLSRFSGALAYRIGPRTVLVTGSVITTCGFALFGILHDLHYWNGIFPAITMVALGMGFTVAPLTATLLESVPEEHVGLASGINNATSRVAGLLAIAVFGALLSGVFYARLGSQSASLSPQQRRDVAAQRSQLAAARLHDPAETAVVHRAYVDGFRTVAYASAALTLLSAAVAALTLPKTRRT